MALAGTQSGKTVTGPPWLYREIRRKGPGDYLVVTPTYPLLARKALPEFLKLFNRTLKLGEFFGKNSMFVMSKAGLNHLFGPGEHDPTNVYFGHAFESESLEAATIKAAWLDEAGQVKFRQASFEAVERRVAVNQGRILITTTPYNLGWLKQRIWDPWEKAKRNHPGIDVIQFDSLQNPTFPVEEYERARRELPRWKFDMFYRAIFTRPAGMIYDCFTDAHKVPRFTIPDHWPRYGGLDFGGVNTAAVFLAEETHDIAGPLQPTERYPIHNRTGRLFVYRDYLAGGRTAAQHTEELRKGEPVGATWAGGSKSEGQWRQEFRASGLVMREPVITDVEVGINRVYAAFQRNELFVFDDVHGLLDEIGSYSREVDDAGNPTEKIADKETWHRLDALRYAIAWIRQEKRRFEVYMPGDFVR